VFMFASSEPASGTYRLLTCVMEGSERSVVHHGCVVKSSMWSSFMLAIIDDDGCATRQMSGVVGHSVAIFIEAWPT
jgi:hypothetical protein